MTHNNMTASTSRQQQLLQCRGDDQCFNAPTPMCNNNNKSIFCKGYMGHVMIICQALVHACSNTTLEGEIVTSGNDLHPKHLASAPPFPLLLKVGRKNIIILQRTMGSCSPLNHQYH